MTGIIWVASGKITPTDSSIEWLLFSGLKASVSFAEGVVFMGFGRQGGKAGSIWLKGIGAVKKEGFHAIKEHVLQASGNYMIKEGEHHFELASHTG